MTPGRQTLRTDMDNELRQLMTRALDEECLDEANILLDALVLLGRGPDADLGKPISAEERMAPSPKTANPPATARGYEAGPVEGISGGQWW